MSTSAICFLVLINGVIQFLFWVMFALVYAKVKDLKEEIQSFHYFYDRDSSMYDERIEKLNFKFDELKGGKDNE